MLQMPFPIATYRDRLVSVRRRMADAGMDTMIITMPDAIHWLTGVDSVGYLWPQALIIPAADDLEVRYVTRTTEAPGVDACSWLSDRYFYDIVTEDPVDAIIGQLRRGAGLAGRVGLEDDAFTMLPSTARRIREAFRDVEFVDCSYTVPDARLIKTEAELAYQRRAAAMADDAIEQVLAAIRPGISEVELAGVAAAALGRAGSEHAAIPPMVVSGERSALVHCMASRRTLSRGDVVCIELAGVVHRYHAVTMRSAVIGAPTARVREVAATLKEAHLAAIDAAVAGVPVYQPEAAATAVLEPAGLMPNRCHRIGYSLGVAYPPGWLEPMMMVEEDPHVFVPGMSFTVEPNLHLPEDGFGLKLGETVECTADGPVSMSRLSADLHVV
ncbi:MAG: aminopeptidase P family protein [Nitriliruptoraceae bacterium]|nr:aminopeptidase P family protein [Nitriliruptoraceae bacterium]